MGDKYRQTLNASRIKSQNLAMIFLFKSIQTVVHDDTKARRRSPQDWSLCMGFHRQPAHGVINGEIWTMNKYFGNTMTFEWCHCNAVSRKLPTVKKYSLLSNIYSQK